MKTKKWYLLKISLVIVIILSVLLFAVACINMQDRYDSVEANKTELAVSAFLAFLQLTGIGFCCVVMYILQKFHPQKQIPKHVNVLFVIGYILYCLQTTAVMYVLITAIASSTKLSYSANNALRYTQIATLGFFFIGSVCTIYVLIFSVIMRNRVKKNFLIYEKLQIDNLGSQHSGIYS